MALAISRELQQSCPTGFSESDEPYLPTDDAENAPTVEAQLQDPNSLLHFVRSLIALRRTHSALASDGSYRTIKSGYPLLFERGSAEETVRVAINASAKEHTLTDPDLGEILFAYNASARDGQITLGSRSCLIYKV